MRWLLLLLLSVGCLAGCGPELDDAVVVKGRHVTVYADPAIPVCEDAVAVADRFVEDTAAMLGVTPAPIDYYLFDGPTGCGYGRYARASCATGHTVLANHWIHFHELVHSVDDSHPPALFVEGLAEALSTPSAAARDDAPPRALARLDFESSVFRASPPGPSYHVAGDFVRYLVERFGPERYRSFARSLVSLADPITIQRAFMRVFAASLDHVVGDWRAADPGTSALTVPVDLSECHDPMAPTERDTWAVDGVTVNGCTTGTTEQGTSYRQHLRRYGFEVTTPGMYVVQVTAEGDEKRGRMWSCAADKLYEYSSSPHATHLTAVSLIAGRHAIETVEDASSWSVARVGAVGDTCEAAPTLTMPANAAWQLELTGPPATWVRIQYTGNRALLGNAKASSPALACSGSCSAPRCQPIALSVALPRVAEEPILVELGSAEDGMQTVIVATREDE